MFIERYELFKQYAAGHIGKDQAITELVSSGVSNEAGAAIRISNAKMIFEANREADAIDIVLASVRVQRETKDQAMRLRSKLA